MPTTDLPAFLAISVTGILLFCVERTVVPKLLEPLLKAGVTFESETNPTFFILLLFTASFIYYPYF